MSREPILFASESLIFLNNDSSAFSVSVLIIMQAAHKIVTVLLNALIVIFAGREAWLWCIWTAVARIASCCRLIACVLTLSTNR